jgi:hypothetical protein
MMEFIEKMNTLVQRRRTTTRMKMAIKIIMITKKIWSTLLQKKSIQGWLKILTILMSRPQHLLILILALRAWITLVTLVTSWEISPASQTV